VPPNHSLTSLNDTSFVLNCMTIWTFYTYQEMQLILCEKEILRVVLQNCP